jgi:putative transcriptional regulator
MNKILEIRTKLGLSQRALADALALSQGNVSHYECGRQEVPPDVARRLIAFAESQGAALTFDDIYSVEQANA